MVHPAHARRLARFLTVIVVAGVGLAAPAASSLAAPADTPRATGAYGLATGADGLAPVAQPAAATPKPLPKRAGTVPVKTGLHIAPKASSATKAPRRSSAGTASTLAAGDAVALRALIVAVDADDFGVPTWKATLDRVGATYDVLYARTSPLSASTLVGADGVGRYNAILLTNSMLLYSENGGYYTALNVEEWNRLWAYERDYGVRQAALYTSYGTWPEDYCLTGAGEGGVGATPLNVSLTATGAEIFDYLKPNAALPVTESYVYRTRVTAGCSAQPVLTAGDDVLGVRTVSPDGRERLALTFTSNQYMLHSHLLAYGMFRWASRGMHLGEQRHFLNIDIDDWFNSADHYYPDGHVEYATYRVSGHDAYNLRQRQTALRGEHPTAANFTFNLALNGEDADLGAGNACAPSGGIDTLTSTTRCLAGDFRWLNHTLTHPEVNNTSYAVTANEITANRTVASSLGLTMPDSVLKTAEYSGLGVYNDDPNNDIGTPTDHGLAASNPNLIAAANDLGVQYLHGNMSFASHQPACFNCGVAHPLNNNLTVVPDWPTNVAYFVTAPDEETAFYNSFYGPNGQFPYWPQNLTYEQILDYEAGLALNRVATGSIYTHTFHIANVRDYGNGQTLVTDWVDRVMDKYESFYQVPLLNPDWPALGAYTKARSGHFAGLTAGATAVYDRVAGTVTVTSPAAATVTVSGVQTPDTQQYGTDRSAPVTVAAAGTVTVTAAPRA